MRLIPLEIGRLESDNRFLSGEDGWKTLPVPSWLIEHPDGLILFDTGLHVDLQQSSDRLGPGAAVFRPDFEPGEELASQLAARDIRASDITHIIFSHLHFDHAGGTEEIPDARVIIQEAEWKSAHHERLIEAGVYNPADYNHGHDLQTITGTHDVFNDGKVVCLPTPGHTAGHQSLRLELDSGPHVLTADCVYFGAWLDEMRVPQMGYNHDLQRESMEELVRLRDQEGCHLLFGHDAQQFRSLTPEGVT